MHLFMPLSNRGFFKWHEYLINISVQLFIESRFWSLLMSICSFYARIHSFSMCNHSFCTIKYTQHASVYSVYKMGILYPTPIYYNYYSGIVYQTSRMYDSHVGIEHQRARIYDSHLGIEHQRVRIYETHVGIVHQRARMYDSYMGIVHQRHKMYDPH